VNIRSVTVERWSAVTNRPFEVVIRELNARIGHPDMPDLAGSIRESAS